jgi:hypothetical protein
MATLDWSQCPAVESVPGRRSGAWVFKDTRMPVATVFENLEVGSSIEEIIEQERKSSAGICLLHPFPSDLLCTAATSGCQQKTSPR